MDEINDILGEFYNENVELGMQDLGPKGHNLTSRNGALMNRLLNHRLLFGQNIVPRGHFNVLPMRPMYNNRGLSDGMEYAPVTYTYGADENEFRYFSLVATLDMGKFPRVRGASYARDYIRVCFRAPVIERMKRTLSASSGIEIDDSNAVVDANTNIVSYNISVIDGYGMMLTVGHQLNENVVETVVGESHGHIHDAYTQSNWADTRCVGGVIFLTLNLVRQGNDPNTPCKMMFTFRGFHYDPDFTGL